jgi:hypothetical protein
MEVRASARRRLSRSKRGTAHTGSASDADALENKANILMQLENRSR